MVETNGVHNSLLMVADHHELRGMAPKGIKVVRGGHLDLHGTAGRVTIEEGATARIHGTVTDGVYNLGGDVEVYGTVRKGVHDLGGTVTVVDPGAVIV
ncbi:hypothetical protein O1Q96_05170 [Streptomyces sp. Qhu-G9]|uniref:hypothetical protein n=1 Tax=Streptomyces sp. Qhu-G9 TaxID=3452799 RepID=UPI0022AC55F5|nr:hypothetical protein [Streptomyces aurantiacus]WAU79195.1 hypothetical protein O1Q96_05170 [Streptomyces aurantiacus]